MNFGSVTVGGFEICADEDLLKDFLGLCKRMESEFPEGKKQWEVYNHVPGFERWFNNICHEETPSNCVSDRELELRSF